MNQPQVAGAVMADTFVTVDLADEAATIALAEDVAACITPGDVVALSGGLGVGKTTFARALIRAVADDSTLDVPSPTFTLAQIYAGGRLTVAHFDFYRLSSPAELDEIGLADALNQGAALIEWPERAGSRLPADQLDVTFAIVGAGRRATIAAGGTWPERLGRSLAARDLLDRLGWRGAARRHLAGDASTRSYERIRAGRRRAVLTDWPPAVVSPLKDGRTAHRARGVRTIVAVDRALRDAGLSAPEIYGSDTVAGFLLMEDLGSEGVVSGDKPIPERYRAAIDVLAAIHCEPRPRALPLPDRTVHQLPPLAADALTAEIALFADWYVPHATGRPLAAAARAAFANLWSALFDRLAAAEQSWVLFDVQSANLIWLAARQGPSRLGLLDFQDMFFGPSAYDVASLCQDARVTVPVALETDLCRRYVALRAAADRGFDAETFAAVYAIAGAVRALKNLGVFARLADHLGQRHYLQHAPRQRHYLVRNFAHPVLSDLAVWYESNLPPDSQAAR